MTTSKKLPYIILFSLIFFAIVLMVQLYFPSHDDYFIPCGNSLSGSVEFVKYIGNGRFLGNFFGCLLSLRPVANVIVKSLLILEIIVCISYLADGISYISIAATCLLLLYPLKLIIAQCYAWSMGFYNYVMPVSFFLGAMVVIRKLYLSDNRRSAGSCILISVLGLCQMLFVENESTIFLAVSAYLLVHTLIKFKDKKESIPTLLFFVFSSVGAFLMFFGPKLFGLERYFEDYRYLFLPKYPYDQYLIDLMYVYCGIQKMIYDFFVVWVLIFVLMFYNFIKNTENRRRNFIILLLMAFLYALCPLLENHYLPIQNWNLNIFLLSMSYTLLYMLLILWIPKEEKIILIIAAFASVFQLNFVNPIGERNVYITYVFFSLYVVYSVYQLDLYKYTKAVVSALAIPAVIIYVSLFSTYRDLKQMYNLREEYIQKQLADHADPVNVIFIPGNDYIWFPFSTYNYAYVYYDSTPGDITFKDISYEDYLKLESQS